MSEKLPENYFSLIENIKSGPNVNIKLPKKNFNSKEEREFFKNLIVHKQKTELLKIGFYTTIVILRIHALLLTEKKIYEFLPLL